MENNKELRELIESSTTNQIQGLNMLKKALIQILTTEYNRELRELIESSIANIVQGLTMNKNALIQMIGTKDYILTTRSINESYTTIEACKLLKISKATLYRLCTGGKLPYTKIGRGKRLFLKHQIIDFINS